jgi:ribosomal protein L30E
MKGDSMATKSILKNISIRDKSLCKSFVQALENAENRQAKKIVLSKSCRELTREQIKKYFSNNHQ